MTDAPDGRHISSAADLALFLGSGGDPFTVLLLELIAEAGPADMIRLKTVYPREVAAWKAWQSMPAAPAPGELRDAIKAARDERLEELERLRSGADPHKVARVRADLEAQIAGRDRRRGGPFAEAAPAEVRAALIEDCVPVFDGQWRQALAEAAESFDLAGVSEMLDGWRLTAWGQQDRQAYWRMMRDAGRVLTEAGRTPEQIKKDLGWPAERISEELGRAD